MYDCTVHSYNTHPDSFFSLFTSIVLIEQPNVPHGAVSDGRYSSAACDPDDPPLARCSHSQQLLQHSYALDTLCLYRGHVLLSDTTQEL